MRCAVFGCGNNNNNKCSENKWRFFHFPKDGPLAKKWLHFCRRKDEVNLKTACICEVHFAPEDFERNLQYEMGLCKKNPTKLLPSAFPTMYVDSLRETDKRKKRIDARSRKQLLGCLLSESAGQIEEIHAENVSVERETIQAPVVDEKDEKMQRLETEMMQGSILDVSMENVLAGHWMSWCRLCAKSIANYVNITELLTGDRSGPYTDVAAAIADFLQTQIKQDEKLPQQVCEKCHQDLMASLKFRNRAIKVQQMYHGLINRDYESKMNLKMFFEKFDLTELASFWENRALVKISASDETLAHTVLMEDCNEDISMTVDVEDVYEDPIGGEEELKSTSRTKKVLYKKLENVTRKKYKKIKKASEQTKYTCKTCSKSFKRGRNFDNHMKNVHGEDSEMKKELMPECAFEDQPKAFLCRYCDQKLESKEILLKHLQSDHQDIVEQTYICETCGRTFRSKGQLHIHIVMHHRDLAPFECKICGMGFKLAARLKRHMEIHEGKHDCNICGKQLSSRTTLNSHLLVHSDSKPHKCDYCGRAFKRVKTLKVHLLAHTGLRPFKCNFCDKEFSTGSSCRAHKKQIHPSEVAAMRAAGKTSYTKNLPKLEALKAVAKTGENFKPLRR